MSNVQCNLTFRGNTFESAKELLVDRLTNTFEGERVISAAKLVDRRYKELVANDVESAIGKVSRFLLTCRRTTDTTKSFFEKLKSDGAFNDGFADRIITHQSRVVAVTTDACDMVAYWNDERFGSVEKVFNELTNVRRKAEEHVKIFVEEDLAEFLMVFADALDEVVGE